MDLSSRIDDLEGRLTKEILDSRNDLGNAIANLDRRISRIEQKIDRLGDLTNTLGAHLMIVEALNILDVATNEVEDIRAIRKSWHNWNFIDSPKIPQEVKDTLVEKSNYYREVLDQLIATEPG